MTENTIVSAIRELTAQDSAKSETARLRAIFDEVEKSLQSGVKQQAMLAVLHSQGFTMTMDSFKSALKRIRKERKK